MSIQCRSTCGVTNRRDDSVVECPFLPKQSSNHARQRMFLSQGDDARTPALLYVDDSSQGQAIEDRAHATWIQVRLTRDGRPAEPAFAGRQHA
jgi:hypothetical protein